MSIQPHPAWRGRLGSHGTDWPSFRGPRASGVSDGKLYLAAEGGDVLVVKAERSFEIPGRYDMGESVMATPGITNGTLYVRTLGHP